MRRPDLSIVAIAMACLALGMSIARLVMKWSGVCQ